MAFDVGRDHGGDSTIICAELPCVGLVVVVWLLVPVHRINQQSFDNNQPSDHSINSPTTSAQKYTVHHEIKPHTKAYAPCRSSTAT